MNKRKVYIITGAGGFLGNNIIRKLASADAEIRALLLPNEPLCPLAGLPCRIYRGDVTKKETLTELFTVDARTDVCIIHCAAIVYIKSKYDRKVYDVNVGGTKNIIEQAIRLGARLVYVSSVHAIPEKPGSAVMTEISAFSPDDVVGVYAKTKAEIAEYVLQITRTHELDACIVHPSGLIGPYDFGHSHLTQLILDTLNRKLTACVDGGYDFVDVRDVADGILRTCRDGKRGECYILSGRYVTVRELLDTVCDAANIRRVKTVLPMWFARMTAPASELYYAILNQPPLYTRYSLYTLTANAHFSCKKAMTELGYRTRDLSETVRDTVQWLAEQGRVPCRLPT